MAWKSGTDKRLAFCPPEAEIGHVAAASLAADRCHEEEVHQVRDTVAVASDRPLRLAGRSGGVEDRRIVVGVDVHGGQSGTRRRGLEDVGEGDGRKRVASCPVEVRAGRPSAPPFRVGFLAGDDHRLEVGDVFEVRGDPVPALLVHEDHLGARVTETVGQFLAQPTTH